MGKTGEGAARSLESFAAWLKWSQTDEILALLEAIKTELGRRGQTLTYEIR
jgi:hypothetical protein